MNRYKDFYLGLKKPQAKLVNRGEVYTRACLTEEAKRALTTSELIPESRRLVYRICLDTGLRRNETRYIQGKAERKLHASHMTAKTGEEHEPRGEVLMKSEGKCYIVLPPEATKDRKGAKQVISPSLYKDLKSYLQHSKLCKFSRGGQMLRDDLELLGMKTTDSEGNPVDFTASVSPTVWACWMRVFQ